MLHALGRDQALGHLLHLARLAAHHEHLETVIVVKVHVQRGEDLVEMMVLEVRQFLVEKPDVVVVNERDRADHLAVRRRPCLFDEFVANQVAESLRPVRVAAPADQGVELFEKAGVDGDADSAQFSHALIIIGIPSHECAYRATVVTQVHIPDGYLATPVWLGLDALSVPVLALVARRAQAGIEETRVPLLGVMGAFVFAAQMINFPVGVGTSGHLVGAALLAVTLGPAAAMVVMTAILAIQAFVFQDGGVLALGANVLNMAFGGVLAAWRTYRVWSGRFRRAALFLAAAASVLTGAFLAIAELLISGVRIAPGILSVSAVLFLVSAAIEGAITVAAVEAIRRLSPRLVRETGPSPAWALPSIAGAAVLLASVGIVFASAAPDGLESLAARAGISSRAFALLTTPLGDYRAAFFASPWPAKAAAGCAGILLVAGICVLLGRAAARRGSA